MEQAKGPGRRPVRQGQRHGPYNPSRHRKGKRRHTEIRDETAHERPCAVAEGKERLEQEQKQEKSHEHEHDCDVPLIHAR